MVGRTISHYRVLEKLGQGGMGEVYRGEDTRLGRPVALKFLAAHVVHDAELRARFEREAKAAAALDHPNVCTLFDAGESDGMPFLAMALVEGETVREKIAHRPLPIGEALDITIQTARGLRAAHNSGIVHRDIKPGNVMVNREGQVKITDFGLALLGSATRITNEQQSMGTPCYMSPEQARGQTADRRTDLWSLGAMTYEMISGRPPFPGDRLEAIVHGILALEPEPLTALRFGVPVELDRIVGKCLAKNPAERYQHADDLIVDLEALARHLDTGRTVSLQPGSAAKPKASRARKALLWAGAGVAVLGLAAAIVFRLIPGSAPAPAGRTVKFAFTPAGLLRGGDGNIDAEVAISRDGKHISYVESEGGQLWVRDIDKEEAHPVPGAKGVYQAFWSADDRFIGYATGPQRNNLVKIPAEGGSPVPLWTMATFFRRGAFSSDGKTIVFCDGTGLYTMPAGGGTPTRIIEHSHIEHPSFLDLPDGRRAFLYQTLDKKPYHEVFVEIPGEGRRHFVTASTSTNPYPDYSPSGHIVYVDGTGDSTAIWALPFSLATLKPTGQAFPVALRASSPQVSRTGTMVYSDQPTDRSQLLLCDREGKTLSIIGERHLYNFPALSPNGRQLAVWTREGGQDIWIYDIDKPGSMRVTTDSAPVSSITWSPSGKEIVYSSRRGGEMNDFDIYAKSPGSQTPQRLVGTPAIETGAQWSPDGRYLIYAARTAGSKPDLLYRERQQDGGLGDAKVFLKTEHAEQDPRFSPDGRHVAYVSDESGRSEVQVRSFPDGKEEWRISSGGGTTPRWRGDGKELYYVQGNKWIMAVSIATGPAWKPAPPRVLMEIRWSQAIMPQYDVSADGKRFLVRVRAPEEKPLAVHVVHNWFEEFRGKH